jgi:transposase
LFGPLTCWLPILPRRQVSNYRQIRFDAGSMIRGLSGRGPDTNSRLTPKGEKKINQLRRWYRRHRGRYSILFEDETDLMLFPPLRAAWAHRGTANKVWLSGRNAKRVIFGAINLATGHHVEIMRPRQRADDFCAFLLELHRRYRRKRLVLLLDRDRSHEAVKSQTLAAKLKISLKWLPVRSPELNPLEALWGYAKPRVCANRQYETIDDEVRKFLKFINQLAPRKALKVCGLGSKNFWLFN